MSHKKTLGIIGGMGPAATIDIFTKIVKLTEAKNDQDHIEIIIHNNTKIPDRTKALLEGETSSFEELLRSARILEDLSVSYIVMPCITSHYYIEDLQDQIQIPIINAIKETSRFIYQNYSHIKSVGLLATSGDNTHRAFSGSVNRVQYKFYCITRNTSKKSSNGSNLRREGN